METSTVQTNYKRYKKPKKWTLAIGVVLFVALAAFVVNLFHPMVKFGNVTRAQTPAFAFSAIVGGEYDTKKAAMTSMLEQNQTAFLYNHNNKWLVVTGIKMGTCGEDKCHAFSVATKQIDLADQAEAAMFNTIIAAMKTNIERMIESAGGNCHATAANEVSHMYNGLKDLTLPLEGARGTRLFDNLFQTANMQLLHMTNLIASRGNANFDQMLAMTTSALAFTLFDFLSIL